MSRSKLNAPAELAVRRAEALRRCRPSIRRRRATAGGSTPPGRASASSGPAACGARSPPSPATAPCTSASAAARRCRRAGPAPAARALRCGLARRPVEAPPRARSCSTTRSVRRASSRREQAPAALREAQRRSARGASAAERRGKLGHRHEQRRAVGDARATRCARSIERQHFERLEQLAQQRDSSARRCCSGSRLDLARDAVELLEHALGGQHAAAAHLVQHPLAHARIDAERDEQRQRQRRELAEREHRDEQQVERRRDGADRRRAARTRACTCCERDRNGTSSSSDGEEHVPDHRADRRDVVLHVRLPCSPRRSPASAGSSAPTVDDAEAAQHHGERVRLDAVRPARAARSRAAPSTSMPSPASTTTRRAAVRWPHSTISDARPPTMRPRRSAGRRRQAARVHGGGMHDGRRGDQVERHAHRHVPAHEGARQRRGRASIRPR